MQGDGLVESKAWRKLYPTKNEHKDTEVTMLISDKVDLKRRNIT